MAAPSINFNIGVLGHIDSGKTSICKILSTIDSTASFDKNPQSKERGITLDLGFSSFSVKLPEHLKMKLKAGMTSLSTYNSCNIEDTDLQYTLVDCPGHASLIKTIIGGAQIIDLVMLVVDVTKGMQTQTAECLIIGQITCRKMIVVLNKTDLFASEKRQISVEKMTRRITKTLESTIFANSPVVAVSAKPGGSESDSTPPTGIDELISVLQAHTYVPHRSGSGAFMCSVDHCFSIKGQGTVMTGTVLSGSTTVGQNVEIPALKITKKIKSMQIFRKPVQKTIQGDRVALCVTQFDPKLLERGLVCTPGALPTITSALIKVHRISYYKQRINTKAKFHITMGHETVMGKATFFCGKPLVAKASESAENTTESFDYSVDYRYQDELLDTSDQEKSTLRHSEGSASCSSATAMGGCATAAGAIGANRDDGATVQQYAVLDLEKPVTCAHNALVIGSRLDVDVHTTSCRLVFHGIILEHYTDAKHRDAALPRVRVYKNKSREGIVERKVDDYSCVCKGLFKKESNMESFVGLKVKLSTGETGVIEGSFGQSGKFKIRIPDGLQKSTIDTLDLRQKKSKSKSDTPAMTPAQSQPIIVMLDFKRYIYDPKKLMHQT